MKTFLLLLFVNFVHLFLPVVCQEANSQMIVGYYPSYSRAKLPADKIQYRNLTHINHAFAWPNADGSLGMYDNFLDPALIQRAHQAGTKVLVALGGWGQSNGFSPMAANAGTRAKFIENITGFCVKNGYDGIDLDWESPANANDRKNLNLLVQELRQKITALRANLLITMAVSAGDWAGQWFDYATLKNDVDWFGCMTYDFHGTWTNHAGHNSPLYAPASDYCGSVETGFKYLHFTRGIPKEKILIGLPFYGREFNAARLYGPSTGGDVSYGYAEIIPKIGSGWKYSWDDFSKVPYLINSSATKLITFDDTTSIRLKCEYALNQKLAGVMIWALGQDLYGTSQPLLATVARSMNPATEVVDSDLAQPEAIELLANYPNPFNSQTAISFYLARTEDIRLEIYAYTGEKITTLTSGLTPAGWHKIVFNGAELASGLYMYRLVTPSMVRAGKMTLVK